MRLVQYYRLRPWQKFDETLLLHRKIGKQQMVIHDDEIGFLRCAPRFDDMAPGIVGAFLPKAIFSGRGHERPNCRILGDRGKFCTVSAFGPMSPLAYRPDITG